MGNTVRIDGIWYYLNKEEAMVTISDIIEKYHGEIVIPEAVVYEGEKYIVTEIWSAFDGCDGLTSITIPESVKEIGSRTFYKCIRLTSITIPESVTFLY